MKIESTKNDERALSDDQLAGIIGGVKMVISVFPSRNVRSLLPMSSPAPSAQLAEEDAVSE